MTGLAAGAEHEEHFRPDLEGLRAVAVGLVMAFHVGLPRIGGGYVGVDVFYVLSGFLITGLLLRELARTDSISLVSFYARRARRLLPAAAFVLVIIVVASALVLSPLALQDVTADAVAASLYVVNLRFALQATDYLAADLAPSPLLHYWSLAVEEQFYLFWPLLLLVATRFRRPGLSIPTIVGIVVVVVGLVSFVASLVLIRVAEPWAFFTLPARAWELALGGALAVLATRSFRLTNVAAAVAVAAGLVMIVAAALLYDVDTSFPGTAALLPSVGAALVIAGGLGGVRSFVSRLLAVRPMRWIGRVSYSLYLWHWPIIVIPVAVFGPAISLRYRLLLMALTFPLAWATTRWVEDPIRHGALARWSPRRTLALAGVATLVVAAISGSMLSWARIARPGLPVAAVSGPTASLAPGAVEPSLAAILGTPRPVATPPSTGSPSPGQTPKPGATPTAGGTPTPIPTETPPPATVGGPVPADLRPPILTARDDIAAIYDDGCMAGFEETIAKACVYGARDSATTVMLIGDSHAASWFGAMDRLASEQGWRFVVQTKSACAFVDNLVWNGRYKRPYTECAAFREDVMARVARDRPALVVVSNSRFVVLDVNGEGVPAVEQPELWDTAFTRTLQRLGESAAHVVIIGDTPTSRYDIPDCVAANPDDTLACSTPMRIALAKVRHAHDRVIAEQTGATFIDPDPLVCPTDPCPPVIGSTLVYRDKHHLTDTFSVALAPYLLAEFPPLD